MASWLARSSPGRAARVQALAGVIALCSWARHFTLSDITKAEFNNCFIHCLKENNDKALSHRTHFIFGKPCSYFGAREFEIALGKSNHVLRTQPTNYSLIC